MAGTKVTMPPNGSTDWGDFVTITQHSYRHFSFVSFTNTTSTGAPAIEEGSYAVVNGTMYSLTPSTGGNETISTTGLSTGFSEGELWIKAVPSTGTSITSEFTTTAPTWSAAKGGYYSTGNDKYLGGVYKTTSFYCDKWGYDPFRKIECNGTRPVLEKQIDIGAWDMDSNISKLVYTKTGNRRVLSVNAMIWSDLTDAYTYPIYRHPVVATTSLPLIQGAVESVYTTAITLMRRQDLSFDSTSFSSTSINRGKLIIKLIG